MHFFKLLTIELRDRSALSRYQKRNGIVPLTQFPIKKKQTHYATQASCFLCNSYRLRRSSRSSFNKQSLNVGSTALWVWSQGFQSARATLCFAFLKVDGHSTFHNISPYLDIYLGRRKRKQIYTNNLGEAPPLTGQTTITGKIPYVPCQTR